MNSDGPCFWRGWVALCPPCVCLSRLYFHRSITSALFLSLSLPFFPAFLPLTLFNGNESADHSVCDLCGLVQTVATAVVVGMSVLPRRLCKLWLHARVCFPESTRPGTVLCCLHPSLTQSACVEYLSALYQVDRRETQSSPKRQQRICGTVRNLDVPR